MSLVQKLLENIGYDIKNYAGSNTLLYRPFYYYRDFRVHWVTEKTIICIEGFPRSGNTFALGAFIASNPQIKARGNIAHHTHIAMQVVRAAQFAVPCITVIRDPISTLASWLLIRGGLTPDTALKHYVWYHRSIHRVKDDVVLADFSAVISDFRKVIDAVNEKYQTNFGKVEITEEIRQEIFKRLRERHAHFNQKQYLLPVPSSERDRLKEPLRERINHTPRLEEALTLYNTLLCQAVKTDQRSAT